MATQPQRRSRLELGGIVVANALKLAAAAIAFHELTGDARATVLGGVAFILTVAQSMESSVTAYFAPKK